MADSLRTPIIGDTPQKSTIASVRKFRQEQQELHGTPLHLVISQAFELHRHRGPHVARRPRDMRHRCGHTAQGMVPLMQLRLEGASDCLAATNRGNCYRKRTASPSSETVARE